ncbi:ARM repeat-containing protein [Gigaspora margarita]|uniref:Importin-13 n=1 Tax=Gigaspora margarita TaxID=4874 RepID=A0A8H4AE16_GIGMA|nr:ARM repeat-containing protein [Gigaspora margarita]
MEFQPPSVSQVEQIIVQLYESIDPHFQKSAQEYIQNLQKQQYAWDLAPQLLASQSVNSQFIGAHIFQVKLSRDWNTLPLDRKKWVRTELLGWIVRLSNGSNIVVTKLCLALTAYALQAVPDIWSNFIPDFFEMLHSGVIAAQNEGQTLFFELPLLEFLTVVPEEVLRADLIGERKAKVHQELTNSIPRVFSTLRSLLSEYCGNPERDIILKQKCLRCLQSWILYGVTFDSLFLLIDNVINLFSHESTNDAATEVLVEFISQPRITSYQNTVCEKMLGCMTSDWAKAQMVNDADESLPKNLCRLMTTFGENFYNYIAKHFLRQDVIVYMEMMLMFAGYPGYFGQDQEISEMPLQFWYLLQEPLFDPDIIPVNNIDNDTVNGEDAVTSTLHITPDESRKIREMSLVVFRRLVEILRSKIQYPPDVEWAEWTKDVKEQFKIYRRNVGDTVMNSYFVLRDQMLAFFVDLAITQLNSPGRDPSQWQDLESTLFCIKYIAEAVDHNESVYLPRLFGAEVYGMLPLQGHVRLRNTALSLIGSYADWFKSHPQYILSALNYLIPALSDAELALSAATSFKEVCDACRDSLVGGIDNLVNMYMVVGPHIQPREKQKVIESIADVIQALSPDKMLQPLLVVTNDIMQAMREAVLRGKQNPPQYRDAIITQLEYLTCCCRGIQPPDEKVIILDDDDYELRNEGSFFDPSSVGLVNTLLEITSSIAEIWYHDSEVIEYLCKFLSIGIRTNSTILSIPFEMIVPLIQISFQRGHHSYWLDTAAKVVTIHGSNNNYGTALRDMLAALTSTTIQHVRCQADMEQYPDIVNSYFSVLTKYLQKCPLLLYTLPSDMFRSILTFSVAGLGLQERLALKSAVTFMGEFIGQNYKEEQFAKGVENVMMAYGLEIMRELLLGIGGRLPRSFVPSLATVLHKITGRYIEASREWLNILLSQENFPSPHVDQYTKQNFAKAILSTRALQRFKDLVIEFSIKCRDLEDSAYGRT